MIHAVAAGASCARCGGVATVDLWFDVPDERVPACEPCDRVLVAEHEARGWHWNSTKYPGVETRRDGGHR